MPGSDLKPNRADLVLFLGLISLFCCPPMGLLAWIMGSSDLKGIRGGTVDSSHVGSLKAGWIMGMGGTGLFAFQVLALVLVTLHIPGSLGDLKGFLGHRLDDFKHNVEKDLSAGPLPKNELAYSGEWIGSRGTVIKIYPNGSADCTWRKDSITSEQRGGRVRIEGDKLSIGFFGLYSTWRIDKPPSLENDTWTMTLDGEVFTRKRAVEGPPPDEHERRQRPREYEV
jgi:hypothetical protein